MTPRRDCKRDANHDEIADTFRRMGCMVIDTHQFAQYLPGYPDLDVRRGGRSVLVEVKADGGRLTPDEAAFAELCAGYRVQYEVVRTAEQAVALAVELMAEGQRRSAREEDDPSLTM